MTTTGAKTLKISLSLFGIASVIGALLLNNKATLDSKVEAAVFRPVAVSVATATRKKIHRELKTIGVIQAYRDVPIIAETQGRVLEKYAELGDHLAPGAPIVKVDTLLKYAACIAAKVNYEKAKKDVERYEALHREGNVSTADLESTVLALRAMEAQYLVAKRQYEDAIIRTPIAGIIAERNVDVGMMVQQGMSVATVVDISRLKVSVSVAEKDASKLKKGSIVEISTDVYPGVTFEGRANFVGPKSSESRMFPVEIVIPNSAAYPLKAGMMAHVVFPSIEERRALVVPRLALVESSRRAHVYVVENDAVHLRTILTGTEFNTDIEVLEGLQEGETVVVSGQQNLRDSTRITIVR